MNNFPTCKCGMNPPINTKNFNEEVFECKFFEEFVHLEIKRPCNKCGDVFLFCDGEKRND